MGTEGKKEKKFIQNLAPKKFFFFLLSLVYDLEATLIKKENLGRTLRGK